MKSGIQIEICAGSFDDVLCAAKSSEVDRIELNCALELGGLTPSLSALKQAKSVSDKKIIAMVRPRPAGFCYSESEKDIMYKDAVLFLENGADGIVFGSLTETNEIDLAFTKKMTTLIHGYHKEAVFHKAFDLSPDLSVAAETLIHAGVDRILTSGGKENVTAGLSAIQALQETYGQRIQILPGGGVSEENVKTLLEFTHCTQIHMSAKESISDNGSYFAVSEQRISSILNAILQNG